MTGTTQAGFAITSHNQGTGSAVTLDAVTITPGETPPPGICPSGWSCTDIGGALPGGSDSLSDGTWSEVGGGGDIWGTSDAFHFAYQTLTGDGLVSAQVASQQNTSAWAKAGVMLRATTDPGSPYYAAFVTPGNGVAVQWHGDAGGLEFQVTEAGTAPVYLEVGRYTSGTTTTYSAYTSSNGTTWTLVPGSAQVLSLPQPLLAGLAITSHNQGTGSAVTLDTVTITPGSFAPSSLNCPASWSCSDIGTVTPIGGQTTNGTAWTVKAGGPDIWGTADAFHYIWQPLAADGTVTAEVATQTATDPWAKAGVMVRATTDPGFAVLRRLCDRGQRCGGPGADGPGRHRHPDRQHHRCGHRLRGDPPDRHHLRCRHLTRWHHLDDGARFHDHPGQPGRLRPGRHGRHLPQPERPFDRGAQRSDRDRELR